MIIFTIEGILLLNTAGYLQYFNLRYWRYPAVNNKKVKKVMKNSFSCYDTYRQQLVTR